jgi:hypothetical protein
MGKVRWDEDGEELASEENCGTTEARQCVASSALGNNLPASLAEKFGR